MAAIALENVSKVFDGRTAAVDDVSLRIEDGQLVVLVGPSGCGKTTLLRLVAGLDRPDRGRILFDTRVVDRVSARDRDVAMVFQGGSLYPHMRVYENLAFALRMHRVPEDQIRRRIERVVSLLGIRDLLDRRPYTLSAGQRQRVALGRAIVREPAVFLLDEPLCNLDAPTRAELLGELRTIFAELQVTTVYVTHDQAEAMMLAQRLCVMYNGRILQCGTPAALYDRPANRFVAGFLGMPAMNFLEGVVRFEAGDVLLQHGDGTIRLPGYLKESVVSYQDSCLVLGVRPEHIRLQPGSRRSDGSISATVEAFESTGAQGVVWLRTRGGQQLRCVVGPERKFRRGEVCQLCLELDRVHLFEPGPIGKNITCGLDDCGSC